MINNKIKIGIPKGSLEKHTLKIFELAGFKLEIKDRSYFLKINDINLEAFIFRSQEIPKYVERGNIDIGISGKDWIVENSAKVEEICDLEYAKKDIKNIKWVLAVPNNSKIKKIKDLEGKIVSTEIVNITKKYFQEKKVKVKVEFSWGATEVKPPLFADAIVDLTETGKSLEANNLKVLDTVFISSTRLIANKKSLEDKWKKEKINNLGIILKGAVEGEKSILMSFHCKEEKIKEMLKIIPKRINPTVTKITGTSWYEINFVLLEKDSRDYILKIKKNGGEGLVGIPLNKVVS